MGRHSENERLGGFKQPVPSRGASNNFYGYEGGGGQEAVPMGREDEASGWLCAGGGEGLPGLGVRTTERGSPGEKRRRERCDDEAQRTPRGRTSPITSDGGKSLEEPGWSVTYSHSVAQALDVSNTCSCATAECAAEREYENRAIQLQAYGRRRSEVPE